MSVEVTGGPGNVAIWDQGLAAARDKLRHASAFVIVTVDKETREVDFLALSHDLAADGMIQLLDTTVGGALRSIDEIQEIAAE